jgi:uncharacterized protein
MRFKEVKSFILLKQKMELPRNLSYHSVEHVKDVYQACKVIAKKEKIENDDRTLLLTAALFHDSGFLINSKDHEMHSCELAKQHLPAYGYSGDQVAVICGMIMATKIPQKPYNHLEQILCDADLDYLGRDDFFEIGDKLFSELSMYGILNNVEDWNQVQIKFLESHHYFTKTALDSRKAKKDAHLQYLKSISLPK